MESVTVDLSHRAKRSRSGADDDAQNTSKRPRSTDPNEAGGPQPLPRRPAKRFTHEAYTVGWICALAIERAAAEVMLDDIHEDLPSRPSDSNAYTLGNIGSHNIVIACLPSGHYGTTNAALVANNMAWSFPSLETRLMVGIGGGVPGRVDVRLGDIVIGNTVFQYDFGKTTVEGQFRRTSIPVRPPQAIMTVVSKLQARHESTSSKIAVILSETLEQHPSMKSYSHPGLEDRLYQSTYEHHQMFEDCEDCDESRLLQRPNRPDVSPGVHYGAIASGNQVIKHGKTRDHWAEVGDAICFEMEAAGLIDHFPCLVIRGICDYADSHKNKKWQKYAALTAAAYTKELLSITDSRQAQKSSDTEHISSWDCHSSSLSQDQRQVLLDSLKFDQIDARWWTIKNAHAKTCKWLLKKDEYCDWLDPTKLPQHCGFLWIRGKPGTGKSTLMKFALANARRTMKKKQTVISFFFNARGEHLEKSTIGMYRSLLLQLIEQLPDLQQVFELLPLTCRNDGQQWSVELLKELFEQALQHLGGRTVVCYIDALDECDEDEIRDMISFFERIGEGPVSAGANFFVCFSSRHYPHITMKLGLSMILEGQEGHSQDITNFVDSELKIGHTKFAETVRTELREKASGIFIWVVLVVDILNKEHDRGRKHALRKRLHEMPGDLYELFRDILTRDSHNRDELLLCVQWVLFAKYPLTPQQLYFAILSGVEDDSPALDEISMKDMKKFILDSSKGMTEVTKSKLPTIQFIHESVRDFLLKGDGIGRIWPDFKENFQGKSHERLKHCCAKHIGIDIPFVDFATPLPRASSQEAKGLRENTSKMFPFLEYAVQQLLYHADKASSYGVSQSHFISCFDVDCWFKVKNLLAKYDVHRYDPGTRLLYILAEDNAPHLIKAAGSPILSWIAVGDERDGNPLLTAIINKSSAALAVFQEALAAGASPESCTQTQLNILPENEILSPLRRDFNFSKNRSTLSYLAEFGYTSLIAPLVNNHRVAPDTSDKDGKTPLAWAAIRGHESTVRFLLETGEVDPNSSDLENKTPLFWASKFDRGDVFKLLLRFSTVDLGYRDYSGQHIQYLAAERGDLGMAKFILETEPDLQDSAGRTLLSWAAEKGHLALASLLLETGKVEPDLPDNSGRTPLSWAAEKGKLDLASLLLKTCKVEPDLQDNTGRTPLSWAAKTGHYILASLLLETGKVEPGLPDNTGRTPLSWAAECGTPDLASLLLETGKVYLESRDNTGRTPFSWAAQQCNIDFIQFLIKTGQVDPDSRDSDGRTPLSHITGKMIPVGEPTLETVLILLDTGKVDPDSRDNIGRTPLWYAIKRGNQFEKRFDLNDVIKALLNTARVDPETEDLHGESPLSLALQQGDPERIDLLQSCLVRPPPGEKH